MATMNVIIYTRVSTDKQSIDSQLQELRNYCERREWTDVQEITDVISGARSSRQGLDKLMGLVRRVKVDVVIAYKLDRLGRSLAHLAQLIGEFATNRTALVIPGQGIDTTAANPAAQLQLNILCAVAEFERELIRERVNAGLAVARAKGVKLGRPAKANPNTPAIAQLRGEGLSGRQIAKRLGLPAGTVFSVLGQLKGHQSHCHLHASLHR
jgi:DNA invertase Pin-like site-specific DNA recombinase